MDDAYAYLVNNSYQRDVPMQGKDKSERWLKGSL